MKSAFAKAETKQYTYPEPLPLKVEVDDEHGGTRMVDNPNIDKDVLAAIKGGKGKEAEEAPWVRLRIPKAKRDVDAIADYTQSIVSYGNNGDGATMKQRVAAANREVFELLVEEWSIEERDPTAAAFGDLDRWAGTWITACLADAMARGTAPDFFKDEPTSSRRRSAGRSGSTPASTSD